MTAYARTHHPVQPRPVFVRNDKARSAGLVVMRLLGLHALVLLAAGVEVAVGLVDDEVDRLPVIGDLQRPVLVDRRVALGLGLAAEELRRGAADHEGLAIALDVHRLVLRLHIDPVANELLALHLGATAHQQCRGQRGAHPLHHRAFSG